MRENNTQILQDTFSVTGTNDAISKYGRGKESAREAAKASATLKLDLEAAYTKNDAARVKPANVSQAGVFAGVQRQIDDANIVYTGGSARRSPRPCTSTPPKRSTTLVRTLRSPSSPRRTRVCSLASLALPVAAASSTMAPRPS
jgi:hypothetical protein